MTKIANPFFILITDRGRAGNNPKIGSIKNVVFENIKCTDVYGYIKDRVFTSMISGLPGHEIENVEFKNIEMILKGNVAEYHPDREIPYHTKFSPRTFGTRPSSGFYCRNTKNILFQNIIIEFEEPDVRPLFFFNQVSGIDIINLESKTSQGENAHIVLRHSEDFQLMDNMNDYIIKSID